MLQLCFVVMLQKNLTSRSIITVAEGIMTESGISASQNKTQKLNLKLYTHKNIYTVPHCID